MITRERLEELIKQRGTIYENIYERVRKVDLSTDHWLYKFKENTLIVMCKQPCVEVAELVIRNLFETKEQAEWALKTVAERTERFEPPMWEDIEEYFDCIDYKFAFIKNNEVYTFTVGKNGAVDITKSRIYGLGIYPIYMANATKETYEKACEIVRDLFKGESDGKNA